MKKNTHRLLLLLGFLACACRWDSSVFPKSILAVLCGIPLFFALKSVIISKRIVFGLPLIWYTLFFALVSGSLLYTANTVDSIDVVRRCLLALILIFSMMHLLKDREGVEKLLKGFVLGAFATLFVTIWNEYRIIGVGRIGSMTCGAATTFSSILLIGLSSLLFLKYFWGQKYFLICSAILVAGIVLSGSRMPLIMVCPIFLIFPLTMSRNIAKTAKTAVVALCLIGIGYFVVMHHPVLYDIVGSRIDSMFDTFQNGTSHETDASLNGRARLKECAIQIWKDHFFLGGGVNSFCVLSPFVVGRSTSHCGFTEILCSFGIVGFILFYWPFAFYIREIWKAQMRIRKIAVLILTVFLLSEWQGVSFLSSANTLFYSFLFWLQSKKAEKYLLLNKDL